MAAERVPLNTEYDSTADHAVAITKSDTVNFANGCCRALYVGGAGDVVAVMRSGAVVTFVGAVGGSVLPIRCIRVNSTSTTATNMVALY